MPQMIFKVAWLLLFIRLCILKFLKILFYILSVPLVILNEGKPQFVICNWV